MRKWLTRTSQTKAKKSGLNVPGYKKSSYLDELKLVLQKKGKDISN